MPSRLPRLILLLDDLAKGLSTLSILSNRQLLLSSIVSIIFLFCILIISGVICYFLHTVDFRFNLLFLQTYSHITKLRTFFFFNGYTGSHEFPKGTNFAVSQELQYVVVTPLFPAVVTKEIREKYK